MFLLHKDTKQVIEVPEDYDCLLNVYSFIALWRKESIRYTSYMSKDEFKFPGDEAILDTPWGDMIFKDVKAGKWVKIDSEAAKVLYL